MTWLASKKLINGELSWERDIWGNLLHPEGWTKLNTYQWWGTTFEEGELIAGGFDLMPEGGQYVRK